MRLALPRCFIVSYKDIILAERGLDEHSIVCNCCWC